ncbi:serine/threonine-protein kinase [Actinocorallia sp. A-T 12471]|uniref:serine/threonine-protein kinase n=1 Tax=Actinocorallia sp. A-T 12471 TaxID=3089813 RepID=UPI0029CF8F90|nr:protein kinase [Actinocorallia sp. A-T 12471]MDX6742460.1 protein kinase [Actinocorallia sp. A-T 12471]
MITGRLEVGGVLGGVGVLLGTDPGWVGGYRLEGRVGVGGQGTVYLGRDGGGRRVAVKVLHGHLVVQEVARARFLDEVELAKRVAPFCSAQVIETGVLEGRPYIVSEFVDGPSLQASVRESGVRGGAALERLALNTVTALAAIHNAGVVHRDFKPGNVILGPDGPVVIDFGIARALDVSQSLTGSQTVGTPGYTAPESFRGDGAGPPADLFAWGATIAYAATGRPAFGGATISAVMYSVLHGEPDLDGLDGRLEAIVLSCLDKDPAKRPTAVEVGDLLRALPAPAWLTGDPVAGSGVDEAAPSGGRDDDSSPPGHGEQSAASAGEHRGQSADALPPARRAQNADTFPPARRAQNADTFPPAHRAQDDAASLDGRRARISDASQHGRGARIAASLGGRRRGVGIAAAAVAVLALVGAGYFAFPSLRAQGPVEPQRGPLGAALNASSPASGVEEALGTPSPTRTPRKSKAPDASPPANPAPEPGGTTASPSASPETPRPTPKPPPPSSPKTVGSVTTQDMARYCSSLGYPLYFFFNDSLTCQGNGSKETTLTAVCRWRYPTEPNVKATGTTCISYP